MSRYRTELIELLGDRSVRELKDAADTDQLTEQDCLELAGQISPFIYGPDKRMIEQKGYSRKTVAVLLDTWYEREPDEVSLSRIVDILRSPDLGKRALAEKIQLHPKNPQEYRQKKHEEINMEQKMKEIESQLQAHKLDQDRIIEQFKQAQQKITQENKQIIVSPKDRIKVKGSGQLELAVQTKHGAMDLSKL